MFDAFRRDLTYTLRGLRAKPAFTTAVVLALPLGCLAVASTRSATALGDADVIASTLSAITVSIERSGESDVLHREVDR